MRRLITSTIAGLLLATAAVAWAPEPSSFEGLMKELRDKAVAAREKGDMEAFRKILSDYAPKFVAFAEKNPKSEEAIEALQFALNSSQAPTLVKGSAAAKALALLQKDHITSPNIAAVVKELASNPDEAAVLLARGVVAKHPDRKIQARACLAVVQGREQLLRVIDRVQKDEDIRAKVEKSLGPNFIKGLFANKDRYERAVKEFQKTLDSKYAGLVPDITIGKVLPDFDSQDLAGKKTKLSDFKGKVVVLDVWATWCGPCRAMIPTVQKLVRKMEGKPFAFVSISIDNTKETVRRFVSKTPMPWHHWYNGPEGGIAEDWTVESIPFVLVLDGRGVIRYKDVRGEELVDAVEYLVKEAERKK